MASVVSGTKYLREYFFKQKASIIKIPNSAGSTGLTIWTKVKKKEIGRSFRIYYYCRQYKDREENGQLFLKF